MASSGWQGRKDFPYNHSDLKCNLRIDSLTHSGDTLRVQGAIGAVDINSSTGYYAWYDYPVYVTPQGGSEMELLSGGERVYGGGENNAKTVGFDVTINCPAANTSANFSVHVRMNNSTSTGDLTWGLTFDASVTPPTGLSASGVSAGSDSFSATVSVTGWGGAGDASNRYRELQVWTQGMTEPRRYQKAIGNSTSSSITCGNSSQGSLTIIPNKTYTLGIYATNGTRDTGSQGIGDYTTTLPTPSVSYSSSTKNSLTMNYSVPNQGGAKTLTLQYKVGSGSWVTITTISSSGAKTGTFTITGLLPNASYSITPRLTATGATTTTGSAVSATTADTPSKWYVSVNNSRKRTKEMYCSVTNTRKRVKKIYGSVNGARALCYEDPNL